MDGVWVILISFIIFLALNVPIAISIGMSLVMYILTTGGIQFIFLATNMFTTCDSFPLLAIPGFILAGALMEAGGLSSRLVGLCDALVGHFTGGLAIVAVVTCMFFGAISGSSPATVAAIGGIMIPAMVSRGYDRSFSVALIAAAGVLGIIIPPSVPMVIYGISVSSASVGSMFLGGFLPGFLCTLALILVAIVICRKRGFKGNGQSFSLRRLGREFVRAIWALLVPVIILGGIYSGVFTPTEAAGIAVAYALVAGLFIYRELNLKNFMASVKSSTITVGSVLIIVSTATALSKVLTMEQVPQRLGAALAGFSDSVFVILLIINLLLLVVGCIMETAAAIMILAPILYPIVAALGISPTHFGLIMVINLGIGMITPPVGVNLFVASGIGKVEFTDLVRRIIPFLIALLISLIFVNLYPPLSTFLPGLFGYK